MGIILNMKVKRFAIEKGYVTAKYLHKWKEYKVFEPIMCVGKISYVGLPLVILVDKKKNIRMSTPEEAMEMLSSNSKK
jgi:hypothetical protein